MTFFKTIKSAFFAVIFIPYIALAAPGTFADLLKLFISLIQKATLLVAGFAFLAFLWGLVRFIFNAGDKNAIESGKQIMIWGIIGLFVMVSIAGILNVLTTSFFGTVIEGFDPIFPTDKNI